jgi:ferredoxin
MENREKYRSHPCELKIMRRRHEKRESRDLADKKAKSGLDEEAAVMEASRCLVNNFCRSCDLCRFICPKGAIKMVQEE